MGPVGFAEVLRCCDGGHMHVAWTQLGAPHVRSCAHQGKSRGVKLGGLHLGAGPRVCGLPDRMVVDELILAAFKLGGVEAAGAVWRDRNQ